MGKDVEECSSEEIARIRDSAIRRALNTPPKPHIETERKSKAKTKKSVRAKAKAP